MPWKPEKRGAVQGFSPNADQDQAREGSKQAMAGKPERELRSGLMFGGRERRNRQSSP